MSTRLRAAAAALLLAVSALPSARAVDNPGTPAGADAPAAPSGYWLTASDGGIFAFGDAKFYGSTGDIRLNQPIVAMAATTAGNGYWLTASDGGIFAFGDAPFYGSTGAIKLNRPIVTMAPTPSGKGYWLAASDGGMFAFGDAGFYGSTGAMKLAQPIVAMAPTASGKGYWLTAADGGVFAFGDAEFLGSTGGRHLDAPIVSMAATPTGRGYWFAGRNGDVYPFGDASDYGSVQAQRPVVSMARTATGKGYWLTGTDGGIFAFGDARFAGSTGAMHLNRPIVGMAPSPARVDAAPVTPFEGPTATTAPAPETTTTSAPAPVKTAAFPSAPPLQPQWTPCVDLEVQTDPTPAVPISESSGMAMSFRYPGVHWVAQDSGHPAALNAVRFDANGVGTWKVIPVPGATSADWESMTLTHGSDGRDRLWVVESGQGGNNRVIYEIAEPNPDTDTTAQLLNTYPWKYPVTQENTEASFFDNDKLVVISKIYPSGEVFRFEQPLQPGVMNVPTLLGTLEGAKSVSEIRFSPDRKLLMTARHEQIFLHTSIDGSGTLESFLGHPPLCSAWIFGYGPGAPERESDNVESGDFVPGAGSDPYQMVFFSESKDRYRVSFRP